MRKPWILVIILAIGSTAAQAQVTVIPTDLGAWQEQNSTCGVSNTGDTGFQLGPGTPPAGVGSGSFFTGADGNSFNTFRYTGLDGVALSSLTELQYSTYVQSPGSGGQAGYLLLNIDYDGDLVFEDQIFFEPVYQTGSYPGDPVPNQGMVSVGVWQTWNALTGGWWSLNDGFGGPPLHTLSGYIADHPTARIVNSNTGLGGFRIASGCGHPAWANFWGNIDDVRIGVSGTTSSFDFEPLPFVEPLEDISQNEGNGGTTDFAFTLVLSHPVSQTVTVDYTLTDGTAVAPGDYDNTGGTASFAPNTTTTTVNVPVVGDLAIEPNETFVLTISNPQHAILGNDDDAEATILNDDFANAALAVTKDGPSSAVPGDQVTYTIVLTNSGNTATPDNAGDELTDVLPSQLTLLSATANSGSAISNIGTNTVTWNGSVPAGGSVTITITALLEAVPPGAVVTNQASVAYDADVNGSNETTVVSDNPDTATPGDPTSFVVGANIAGIPTTSQWGLLLLALSMACLAALRMR